MVEADLKRLQAEALFPLGGRVPIAIILRVSTVDPSRFRFWPRADILRIAKTRQPYDSVVHCEQMFRAVGAI
jgi:hypothetical protein